MLKIRLCRSFCTHSSLSSHCENFHRDGAAGLQSNTCRLLFLQSLITQVKHVSVQTRRVGDLCTQWMIERCAGVQREYNCCCGYLCSHAAISCLATPIMCPCCYMTMHDPICVLNTVTGVAKQLITAFCIVLSDVLSAALCSMRPNPTKCPTAQYNLLCLIKHARRASPVLGWSWEASR